MAATTKLRSPIWNYFSLHDNDHSKAVCKICKDTIPRGGSSPKSFNTTNLRKHLEHHQDKYKELLEVEKEKVHARDHKDDERQDLLQPKIDKSFEQMKPYATDSS